VKWIDLREFLCKSPLFFAPTGYMQNGLRNPFCLMLSKWVWARRVCRSLPIGQSGSQIHSSCILFTLSHHAGPISLQFTDELGS
jgi:hypothetical protein